MKDFDEILTQLRTDLAADIPVLLSNESLTDFAEYEIGPSRDPSLIGLYIYFDIGNFDAEMNSLSLIIQLQLHEIAQLTAAKYAKVVYKYLISYNPANLGFVYLESLEFDNWPIEQNSSGFVYLIPTWQEELDSCDEE